MQPDTLAIVVTYNRSTMLAGCLSALQRQTAPCHILVVDNASTDDTQQVLRPYLGDQVRTLVMERNLGGAGGFHAGMLKGVQDGYRYLWLMDDDTYPEADALAELLQGADRVQDQFGFLSSVALWTDGTECRMNRQKARKSFYNDITLLKYGMLAIEQATFVSCFVQATTVRQLGLPITEFFIWGDDIEYTRRIAVRNHLPCYLAGRSCVVHHMNSNSGSNIATESMDRLARFSYAYRNECYLYRKEGAKGIVYYLMRCGLHFVRIWKDGRDHRFHRSGILLKAFFKGWLFHPKVKFPS